MIARPTLLGLLLSLLAGCASDWKIVDGDGDGISPAEGDCWDGVEGPPGSGLTGADIYPGAPDTPYDGFDADCAGNDDYDLDGDGYVTEASFVGLETYAVAGTGAATLSGDCWDDPDTIPDGFTAINGFAQPAAADVNPDAADTWYDAVDSDCASDDDFDADTDGYASSYYADATGAFGEDCFDEAGDDFFSGDFLPEEINPDAAELCGDHVDNDCDTAIDGNDDDAEAVFWYPDADEDSFGDIDAKEWGGDYQDAPDGYAIRVCDDPSAKGEAYVIDNTDCDDDEVTTYPDAPEACDKVDNDCNGVLDDDYAEDAPTFYADTDSDGFGDPKAAIVTCYQPSGYSVDATDCDDDEALICPGCGELESLNDCMADLDEDGYGDASPGAGVTIGTDCNDNDDSVNPGETETVGNEVDNDCDGGEICYLDDDNDNYINDDLDTIVSSDADCQDTDEGTSSQPRTDCDDSSATTYPGAAPNDSSTSCMKDDDGDNYGDADAPAGVTDGTDCDDDDATINIAATEIAGDEVDQDCDNQETCYTDADDDGYRPDSTSTTASADTDCTDSGEAVDSDPTTDCDDNDATSNPGATEIVGNEVDNDCSGGETCYLDNDDDGYRPDSTSTKASTDDDCQDAGEATSSEPTGDCDDSDATSNPGETETVGNEVDNDCDGGEICYLDDDNDNYVNDDLDTIASSDTDCTDTDEGTSSQPRTDCDDSSATTYPGAAPNDSSTSCMKDDDGDNYGDADAPAGVTDGTDCDDDDATINTAATEIAGDQVDQNCDNKETCYADADNDGYRPDSTSTKSSSDTDCTDSGEALSSDPTGDCDDNDATSNPGAAEIVGNEVDNDCSGGETCYLDNDNDGYRPDSSSTKASTDDDCQDSGEATSSEPTTDCDDNDATSYPGAPEICGDGISDQDCDNDAEECTLTDLGLVNADAKFAGSSNGDYVGDAVVMVDLTGDGDLDLLIGAQAMARVYMVAGTTTADATLSTDADATFTGATSTGYALAAAGDVNDDGYEDVLIGAYNSNPVTSKEGTAYLLLGPVSSSMALGTSADVVITGEDAGTRLGISIAGVGDQNTTADGYADFLIGSERGSANALSENGAAYLIYGAASFSATMTTPTDVDVTIYGTAEGDYAGCEVATAGDVDGDGREDVLIGAYNESTNANNAGAAYLLYGPVDSDTDVSAGVTFLGTVANGYAGLTIAAAGDVSNDGYGDILIGAYGDDEVYLIEGSSSTLSDVNLTSGNVDTLFTPSANTDRLGYALAGAGDLSGDGIDDIMISADKANGFDGEVYIFYSPITSGTVSVTNADVTFVGENGGRAGYSLFGGEDYDGDGINDIFIGSYKADSNWGAAYLILGMWE